MRKLDKRFSFVNQFILFIYDHNGQMFIPKNHIPLTIEGKDLWDGYFFKKEFIFLSC